MAACRRYAVTNSISTRAAPGHTRSPPARCGRFPSGALNVWEANWCGDDAIVAVVSTGATEGDWYRADLARIDVSSGDDAHAPFAAGSAGLAVRLALWALRRFCRERVQRSLGRGGRPLMVLDISSGRVVRAETGDADISSVEWLSAERLLVAGLRGCETVVGHYDRSSRRFEQLWASTRSPPAGSASR